MTTYVVDQNMMRDPALAQLIQSDNAANFIVPDTAWVEMIKSEQWLITMQRSLASLVPATSRTFGTISIGEGLRSEKEAKSAMTREHLICPEITSLIRDIIATIVGNDAGRLNALKHRVENIRERTLAENADSTSAKRDMDRRVLAFMNDAPPAAIKDLRRNKIPEEIRLG